MAERPGDREAAVPPPMPFVVGVNRSGTTLLRMMLDAHPELAIPPETHFVPDVIGLCEAGGGTDVRTLVAAMTAVREWDDFGLEADELAEALAGPAGARGRARRCAASTASAPREPASRGWGRRRPAYGRSMTAIARALPEARFVHVIRDGRDVAPLDPRPQPRRAPVRAHRRPLGAPHRGRPRAGRRARAHLPRGPLRGAGHRTRAGPAPDLRARRAAVEPADARLHRGAARRLEEMNRSLPARGDRADLSAERRIELHERVTRPPDPGRIDRWRTEMSAEQRREFEDVAGDLLAELGYRGRRRRCGSGS